MSTVGQVAVKVGMDSSEFRKGSQKMQANVRGMSEDITNNTRTMRKWGREAQKVFESTRTPAEKYNAEVARLANLHKKGFLDQDTYARALKTTAKQYGVATTQAERFHAVLGKFSGLAKIARYGMLAVGGAVAGIGYGTMRQMQEMDKIAKFARRIGIGTEDLSGLHHAAGLSGVGTDTLNMALQRMTRRLSEAAAGSGEARGALRELGVDARVVAKMTPNEALKVLADRLMGVTSESDRLRLAFKLFDSEGTALLPMLEGGSRGLEKMQAEAKALGLTFSEFDAERIERANDAMKRMKATGVGMSRELALQFAPIGERFSEFVFAVDPMEGLSRFQKWTEAGIGVVHDLARWQIAVESLGHRADQIKTTGVDAARLKQENRLRGREFTGIRGLADETDAWLKFRRERGFDRDPVNLAEILDLSDLHDEFKETWKRIQAGAEDAGKGIGWHLVEGIKSEVPKLGDALKSGVAAASKGIERYLTEPAAKLRENLNRMEAEAESMRRRNMTDVERARADLAEVAKLYSFGQISAETAARETRGIMAELDRARGTGVSLDDLRGRGATAMVYGSAEAYAASLETGATAEEELVDETKTQTAAIDAMRESLEAFLARLPITTKASAPP